MDKLGQTLQLQTTHPSHKKVLTMVKNERMGGYVPKWETPKPSAQNTIEQNLSQAQYTRKNEITKNAMAYSGTTPEAVPSAAPQEFTFGDMVDMVNPLHHIPIVGHAYRHMSGDEIKPISQIIGGAVFGGPVGAASGLVNVIVEEETGKDLTGNAIAMARGELPTFREKTIAPSENPENRLNEAVQIAQDYEDLSNSLLAFSDLSQNRNIVIERKEEHARPAHMTRRYNG